MEKQERAVAPGWWHSLVPLNYGWEACQPGHTFGPAARHYHLLHFVLKGEGTFLKGGEWHQVGPGDLFVILPEEITTYCASLTDPWEYVWISFLASETPAFLKGAVIRQPPVYKLFERLRDLCLQDPEDGKIFAVLYDLLDRLSRDAPVSARRDAYAAYAKAYLETMYMQPVSIQQIADTLHIDRRYLTALFRQAYGQSPKAYRFSAGWRRVHNPITGHDVADDLTTTEFAVCMLAARGWNNQDIGELLHISANTIKKYIGVAKKKLGISTRGDLKKFMMD